MRFTANTEVGLLGYLRQLGYGLHQLCRMFPNCSPKNQRQFTLYPMWSEFPSLYFLATWFLLCFKCQHSIALRFYLLADLVAMTLIIGEAKHLLNLGNSN